jgi:hypothetical protein
MANDGKYITLDITPTVNKDDTEYRAEGQWADSNNIQFHHNRPRKRQGWQARSLSENFTGRARDLISWKELNNVRHYAAGTHAKLQIEQLGTLYDLTPIITVTTVTNSITVSSGGTTVIVSAPSHTAEVGDYVLLSVPQVSVGGITLNDLQFAVVGTPDNNSFILQTSTTATATSAATGGDVVLNYLLETGNTDAGAAYGYGAGSWNTAGAVSAGVTGGWSDPRGGDGIDELLTTWFLDTWGEDLIACRRGGRVYTWDATTSVNSRATIVSAAPVSNNIAFVHPNRHLVLLGTWPVGSSAIDPLEIRWSDRENFNEFQVSAGTRAGSFRLQGGGNEIVGYCKSKRETMIFTDSTVWSMRALNNTAVFGFDQVGTNNGLMAPHAAVDVDGIVYWMSQKNFYYYNGQVIHLDCTVEDFIFDNIDFDQKDKIFAGVNTDYEEIIWLYQSLDSTGDIDKYVKYNWDQNSWDVGEIDRLVWDDSKVLGNPISISLSGQPYNEAKGVNDDNVAMKSFIETSYFDIEDGTNMVLLDQFIPDFTLSGSMNFTVYIKKWPNGPEEQKGPFEITPNTQKVDLRARGRQMKVRYSTSALNSDWELGKPRFRIKPDGER